jgi:ribosomal protein RSM22 (predicted rRNA methylase)
VIHWRKRDLEILSALRTRFLTGGAGAADYWQTPEELRLYDETFAARIGWKIDAVLRGLAALGWRPRARRIIDWGCGTGIATRRVLAAWPDLAEVALHDRSPSAVAFARQRITTEYPHVAFDAVRVDADTLLVLSHVLNELPTAALDELLTLAQSAGEVLWVEAGTHADSHRLIAVRERLLADAAWQIIAPCPHRARCGLLTAENARHWCHHFAEPPPQVFQSARWSEWSRALGIDLRALPYSHLVLTRHHAPSQEGSARILGRPDEGKGHLRVLACEASGVRELMLQKRDAPELHRALRKSTEHPPQRWRVEASKIVGLA